MVYKDLQKKTYPPHRQKIHITPAQIKQNPTKSNMCSNIKTKLLHPYTNQSLQHQYQQSSDMHLQELKSMMKGRFEQIGSMLNLLTAMFTKLK
jgi:hypothetical protein